MYITIENKCKECPFKNKENYQRYRELWCEKYHCRTSEKIAENCEYDTRHYCKFCGNFINDKCKIDGHFKDGETLRVCKSYILRKDIYLH